MPPSALLGDPRPEATAQLHYRLGPPLLALAFALLAVPLGRSSPRQTRYGRVMLGFLAYMVGTNLMWMGTDWLAKGKMPLALGLGWMLWPLLAIAAGAYVRAGRLRRAPMRRAARGGGVWGGWRRPARE